MCWFVGVLVCTSRLVGRGLALRFPVVCHGQRSEYTLDLGRGDELHEVQDAAKQADQM